MFIKPSGIFCKRITLATSGQKLIVPFFYLNCQFKLKEWYESGANSLDSSNADQYANSIGKLLGTKYQNGSCDEYIQKYIQKKLKIAGLFFVSAVSVIIVACITFVFCSLADTECSDKFIQGCMAAGETKEVCSGRYN